MPLKRSRLTERVRRVLAEDRDRIRLNVQEARAKRDLYPAARSVDRVTEQSERRADGQPA